MKSFQHFWLLKSQYSIHGRMLPLNNSACLKLKDNITCKIQTLKLFPINLGMKQGYTNIIQHSFASSKK